MLFFLFLLSIYGSNDFQKIKIDILDENFKKSVALPSIKLFSNHLDGCPSNEETSPFQFSYILAQNISAMLANFVG
jgi:hypothetical protein